MVKIKMMFKPRTFIFFISFLLVSVVASAATQRGIAPVPIKDRSGNQVLLYQESHALLVGVSEYTQGWPNLPGVREDISKVKIALEDKGFHTVIVMNPTRIELIGSIEKFINLYGQDVDNRLIFYFAGHGHTMESSYGEEMGYFVPSNAPNPNIDKSGFRATSINMESIEVYSKKVQSKHALFLFDSCFSGSIFALSRAIPENISFKTSMPVRQFITAGSANETVPDESIFNDQLIRALNGEGDLDDDGYLTGVELGEYLNKTVVNYSKGSQHPQYGKIRNPNLDKGDFVFSLFNIEHIEQSVSSIIQEREQLEQNRLKLEKKRKQLSVLQRMREEKKKLEEEERRFREEQGRLTRLQQPQSPLRDFAGSGESGDSGFFSEEPVLKGFSSGSSSNSNYAGQRKTKLAPHNIFAMDYTSNADYASGKRIYNQTAKPMACKMCHGKNGDGGGKLGKALRPPPSNFTSMDAMKDVSPGQMFWIIKKGSRGTGMVAHAKTLNDKEIWDVIKYIRQSWVKPNRVQDQQQGSSKSFEEKFTGKTNKQVRVTTVSTPLRVWVEPSRSRVVAQVPTDSIYTVLNETGKYYQIEYSPGKKGWISKKYSRPLNYNPTQKLNKQTQKLNKQTQKLNKQTQKLNKQTSKPSIEKRDLLKELEKLAKLESSVRSSEENKSIDRVEPKKSETYDSVLEKFESLAVESQKVKVETLDTKFQSKLQALPDWPKLRDSKVDVQFLYARLVQEKIYKNWGDPLAERHERNTSISFHIFPNGNIDKPFIKQSSGVEQLDELAIRAVLDSAPFPNFPKELKKSNLLLSINFKYVPKNDESKNEK